MTIDFTKMTEEEKEKYHLESEIAGTEKEIRNTEFKMLCDEIVNVLARYNVKIHSVQDVFQYVAKKIGVVTVTEVPTSETKKLEEKLEQLNEKIRHTKDCISKYT